VRTRDEYYDVFDVYLPVALAVFVVVCAALAFVVWRGKRRRDEPSTRKNNVKLEVVYAVGLAAVAAALLTLTLRTHAEIVDAVADGPAERIDVVAAKWNWRFEYPRYGIVEQGTDTRQAVLVVPRGEPVDFHGRSLDVIHGFWVPQERFQVQLFNDRVSDWRMTFGDDADGESAPCSFYCGLGHRTMRFRVEAMEPAEFRRWVERRRP
jgi:cytochrome c oxidase subunit 2